MTGDNFFLLDTSLLSKEKQKMLRSLVSIMAFHPNWTIYQILQYAKEASSSNQIQWKHTDEARIINNFAKRINQERFSHSLYRLSESIDKKEKNE